jgi:hypothetical protein
VVAGTAVHGTRVRNNFAYHHWEDWRFFRHNKANVHSPLDCFTRPSAWPGLYRPLSTSCYYLAGRSLFANRVEAYHAVNAVVFVANALLLFAIARALLPWPWPLLAPVLLVSRLAHVQVLLYTSEFQVLSATLFSLLALRLDMAARRSGRRGLLVAALIGFALALLCKETAIVLPAIVSAYAWLYEWRWRAWREAAWWMVAASWAVVFALFRRAYPEPTGFQYDLSWAVLPRLSGYFLVFWNDLVYPMDDLELVSRVARLLGHPLAGLGAAALVLITAVLLVRARQASGAVLRALAFGLVWFVAAAAAFLLLDERLFMRYSYFPHAGLSLAATAALAGLVDLVRRRLALRQQRPQEVSPGAGQR